VPIFFDNVTKPNKQILQVNVTNEPPKKGWRFLWNLIMQISRSV